MEKKKSDRYGKKRRGAANRSGARDTETDDTHVEHHPHHRGLEDAARDEEQIRRLKNLFEGVLNKNVGNENRDVDGEADQRRRRRIGKRRALAHKDRIHRPRRRRNIAQISLLMPAY